MAIEDTVNITPVLISTRFQDACYYQLKNRPQFYKNWRFVMRNSTKEINQLTKTYLLEKSKTVASQ